MKNRLLLLVPLWITTSCGHRDAKLDLGRLFEGFTYVGSYESKPLLRVPESELSHGTSRPTYAKNGLAFVYIRPGNETFGNLAQAVLPKRLKAQGFAAQITPESNVTSYATFDDGASFTIVFSRGKCNGYLFGRQKAADEKFILQLDSDSGCPE
jgi:hypothetical protein